MPKIGTGKGKAAWRKRKQMEKASLLALQQELLALQKYNKEQELLALQNSNMGRRWLTGRRCLLGGDAFGPQVPGIGHTPACSCVTP